jgi:hypothetical protein
MVPKGHHELRDAPKLSVEQIREIGLCARCEAAEARAALQRALAESREALKRAHEILSKR